MQRQIYGETKNYNKNKELLNKQIINMKQITTISIGLRSFTITVEAYQILDSWLKAFRASVTPAYQADDVMHEIEDRISDLFYQEASSLNYVVDVDLVNRVINQLGMPDGSRVYYGSNTQGTTYQTPVRKFYRDSDDCKIGGVCSGLALYFNIDTLLVRILFLIMLICATFGFWIYIILWILAPKAETPLQKCEMRGIPPTAENLRRFSK